MATPGRLERSSTPPTSTTGRSTSSTRRTSRCTSTARSSIRTCPKGYAPFNVTALGGKLYVSYAEQDAAKEDEVAGPGKGIVDVFDTGGPLRAAPHQPRPAERAVGHDHRARRLRRPRRRAARRQLRRRPHPRLRRHDRGPSGTFRRRRTATPIVIDGLWALMFGNGTSAGTKTLLFSAGPDDETPRPVRHHHDRPPEQPLGHRSGTGGDPPGVRPGRASGSLSAVRPGNRHELFAVPR